MPRIQRKSVAMMPFPLSQILRARCSSVSISLASGGSIDGEHPLKVSRLCVSHNTILGFFEVSQQPVAAAGQCGVSSPASRGCLFILISPFWEKRHTKTCKPLQREGGGTLETQTRSHCCSRFSLFFSFVFA